MRVEVKGYSETTRIHEVGDILDYFKFFRVIDGGLASDEVCDTAALTALSSFSAIDPHYTYTLPPNSAEGDIGSDDIEEVVVDEDDEEDNGDDNENPGGGGDDQLRFVSIE